ncbi:MAG: site-2 protease family protein [Desulfobacterota bacterium]|nr:site-2 protease family protein [Thermodesulfobacteriota bacterium]MDW8001962.1 site-2 protease family protein [Deltaproteobacteria bacterium]
MFKLILFILTVLSTTLVGGPQYSFAIMTILLAHEMGHYFMSKRYGIPASLPYFIPFPLSPFGTFGAIIKMKGIIINKKALFDIGVAGPIMSFIFSLPFTVIGMKLSNVQKIPEGPGFIRLGDPYLFKIVQRILFGELPSGYDIVLHPFGYAGWVGLFVTALNLLPVGQLDGGHVIYAIFGPSSRVIYFGTMVFMILLSVFYNPGWLALVLLLMIFGMRHPEPYDMETELDRKRKFLAILIFFIFALSFTPSPFPEFNVFDEIKKGL